MKTAVIIFLIACLIYAAACIGGRNAQSMPTTTVGVTQ